jgi:phosphoserine phosphatase RsbU/P
VLSRVDDTTVLNPILLAKGIRALVGVPLIASGKVIGVLHVGSLTNRQFTAEELELLELAAQRAATALASLMAREDRMAAGTLQRSLLPPPVPAGVPAEMAVRYVPAKARWAGTATAFSPVLPGTCGQ